MKSSASGRLGTSRLFCSLALALASLVATSTCFANTVTSRVTGNWNTASTWVKTLTGTVSTGNNSPTVTGSGTLFTTELVAGDLIARTDGTVLGTVSSIQSATSLTLTGNASVNNLSNVSYGKEAVPGSSDDVVISSSGTGFTVTLDTTTTC